MVIEPGSANPQGGSRAGDTAELRLGRPKPRRPVLALALALLSLAGAAVAGFEINGQLKPRQFTAAQAKKIEAWEVARRWRTIPRTRLFPAQASYQVGGADLGSGQALHLDATRLEIAQQAPCGEVDGARQQVHAVLDRAGCQALLRATYSDATGSLVLTVGVVVVKDAVSASTVATFLTGRAPIDGAVSRQLVLHPLRVGGTPAALFGMRQRQLTWVVGAGPYVVVATVGFADGRPRVSVTKDAYTYQEMTSLARGVAAVIATPLAATPPAPRCPGALSAC